MTELTDTAALAANDAALPVNGPAPSMPSPEALAKIRELRT
jgi:hypothetical protein